MKRHEAILVGLAVGVWLWWVIFEMGDLW